MEIVGKVISTSTIKKGVSAKSGKEWQSFEFVVETDEQYPKHANFKLFGEEKIKDFGKFCKPGENLIKVFFDVDANEYQGKWYNTLSVWKIEVEGAETANAVENAVKADPFPEAPANTPAPAAETESDGLPF